MKTTVIPVVIGALGTITNKLTNYLKLIGVNISFEKIQKSALLGSGFILRKETKIKNKILLPKWKKKLMNEIENYRKDISLLSEMKKENEIINSKKETNIKQRLLIK